MDASHRGYVRGWPRGDGPFPCLVTSSLGFGSTLGAHGVGTETNVGARGRTPDVRQRSGFDGPRVRDSSGPELEQKCRPSTLRPRNPTQGPGCWVPSGTGPTCVLEGGGGLGVDRGPRPNTQTVERRTNGDFGERGGTRSGRKTNTDRTERRTDVKRGLSPHPPTSGVSHRPTDPVPEPEGLRDRHRSRRKLVSRWERRKLTGPRRSVRGLSWTRRKPFLRGEEQQYGASQRETRRRLISWTCRHLVWCLITDSKTVAGSTFLLFLIKKLSVNYTGYLCLVNVISSISKVLLIS